MQTFKNIKNFVAKVTRASLKEEKHIRMTIDDAHKLHAEINMLLLELKETSETANKTITLDGGNF